MEQQRVLRIPSPIILENGRGKLVILPSVHNSLLFSQSVVALFETYNFTKVLVEFPSELESIYRFSLRRFPVPTVIHPSFQETLPLPLTVPTYIVHPGDSIHMASHLAIRSKVPFFAIDTLVDVPETLSLRFDPAMVPFMNWVDFYGKLDIDLHLTSIHALRSHIMAERILERFIQDDEILVVAGLMHVPILIHVLRSKFPDLRGMNLPQSIEKKLSSYIPSSSESKTLDPTEFIASDIHPHSFYLVSGDFPFLVGRLMKFVEGELPSFDLLESLHEMLLLAETVYREQFEDTISPATYKRMFQFMKNLSWLDGELLPSLNTVIMAAKGMVDDDYAFEVFRTLVSYPYFPKEDEGLPLQLRVVPDKDAMQLLSIAFKRRMKRPVLKRIKNFEKFLESRNFDDLDPIPEEEYPGHWRDIWDQLSPYSTVSYPPEDEFIEAYFMHLRKQGERILQEEKARVEEFRVSMEDGIAWRETIRNFHEKKIYIKKVPKLKEEIGALIVQFVVEQDEEYDHHSVLYAEHDKESDISIVSTSPGDIIVGPGITRIKLAAVVSVFPPQGYGVRVPYGDRDLTARLLFTAMSMATSKIILLVSPHPPKAHHKQFVESEGFRLIYLPMANLSKATLHRLRIFHLLAHPDLRDIAREYIGY
ncbi:MAG: hypothetical protein D6732_01380 [Methanobacteriota archaeon]|nr:MAG: hypothetical protein D6732_01380 [Euryarchaeota archaeon]